MLYITIIALVSLTVWTYIRWETISPKLVVRELFSLVGMVAGSTPQVVITTVKAAKTANAVTELELKQAGSEGPVGFVEGRSRAGLATQKVLQPINDSLDATLESTLKELDSLK